MISGFFLPPLGNSLYAAPQEDRLNDVAGNVELVEESVNDIRDELDSHLRVSGYVDVEYIIQSDKNPAFRNHHLSIFFQKRITDKWKFFSEIEYEDTPKFEGSIAEGKVFVEAVSLDYLWKQEFALRFGRFFTPAGIWSVDHYPPFVPTQERPQHIRKIFPQLVEGTMAFGTFQFDKHFLKYDAYYVNGENEPSNIEQNAEKAFGLNTTVIIGVPLLSQLELGGTFYTDPRDNKAGDRRKTSIGVHAKARFKDFTVQSEAAFAKFNGGSSNKGTMRGYYVQAIYEPNAWSGGIRYDVFDNDRSAHGEKTRSSVFINYRFSINLVVKAEHHITSDNDTNSNKTIFSVVSYLE